MSSHFSSIVLAYDGSENSYKALIEAEKLAKLSQARLMVLYVKDPTPTYNQPMLSGMIVFNQPLTVASPVLASNDDTDDQTKDPSETILSEAKLKLSSALKNLDFEKRTGKPAEEICDYAKHNQADLIVIGSRGLSGFQKLIMGSVSSQVTHNAECPVLVVK
ncbi:universal stress protein [Pullulanibacillus sp. KACC 23026]|uniref:universal stress protein n=1 Tax=Pullulanibacillus sp. KACC 23026 TaxID=3028315 RepID=UPI0023AFF005|nr:universal stress protein [Pullulanibacillus sp. KACC 23026]WEG11111.1 universal stress protein [Pullulanibacillus sp. KACC 23026]